MGEEEILSKDEINALLEAMSTGPFMRYICGCRDNCYLEMLFVWMEDKNYKAFIYCPYCGRELKKASTPHT